MDAINTTAGIIVQTAKSRVQLPMMLLEFFIDNLNGRTMALGSTQPPTEMSLFFFVFCGAAAQRRSWSPHSRGFLITHDTSQSVGLLWTSDQLVAETST